MKLSLSVLMLAIGLAVALPTNVCHKKLLEEGFSRNFNETNRSRHSLHDCEGLQLFNPRATEKNTVPTVNMDRHALVT